MAAQERFIVVGGPRLRISPLNEAEKGHRIITSLSIQAICTLRQQPSPLGVDLVNVCRAAARNDEVHQQECDLGKSCLCWGEFPLHPARCFQL